MATLNANNLVSHVGADKKLRYPILSDGTADINGGDLCFYDTAAKALKPIASDANAEFVAGVAEDASFVNLYGTKKYKADLGAHVGQIHSLKTTAGETYEHGATVGIGADAQTIKLIGVGVTKPVGYIQLRPGQSPVLGASGVNVDVLVVAKFPTTIA